MTPESKQASSLAILWRKQILNEEGFKVPKLQGSQGIVILSEANLKLCNIETRGSHMSVEKTQGTGTTTMDAPAENNENTVEVTFLPEGKTVTFEHGKLPYKDHGKEESLLDVALNFGVKLDHACGGNCACTTCHVWVKEGADLLTEMEDDEADKLDMAADLQLNSRLGCQTVIKKPGKLVVEIPAWNRNYVSEEH
jgi:ferredoxin, 2Fe-2S